MSRAYRGAETLGAPPPPPPPLPCARCGGPIKDGQRSIEVAMALERGAGLQLVEVHERCGELQKAGAIS